MMISNQALEAAAEAIMHAAFGQEPPEAPDDLARAALEAAGPIIRAEALSEAVSGVKASDWWAADVTNEHGNTSDAVRAFLRARAVAGRGRQ